MSKAEIINELSRLSIKERAEVQAKLDELAADQWQDSGELSDADRRALDSALGSYAQQPNAGSKWEDVKARIEAKLR